MQFKARQDDGTFAHVDDRSQWNLRGSVFLYGSCQPHVLTELSRVGWGAAMFDDDGACLAVASGTVPSCIGQTSYASEWCAAAVVAHLAVERVDGAQDITGL